MCAAFKIVEKSVPSGFIGVSKRIW